MGRDRPRSQLQAETLGKKLARIISAREPDNDVFHLMGRQRCPPEPPADRKHPGADRRLALGSLEHCGASGIGTRDGGPRGCSGLRGAGARRRGPVLAQQSHTPGSIDPTPRRVGRRQPASTQVAHMLRGPLAVRSWNAASLFGGDMRCLAVALWYRRKIQAVAEMAAGCDLLLFQESRGTASDLMELRVRLLGWLFLGVLLRRWLCRRLSLRRLAALARHLLRHRCLDCDRRFGLRCLGIQVPMLLRWMSPTSTLSPSLARLRAGHCGRCDARSFRLHRLSRSSLATSTLASPRSGAWAPTRARSVIHIAQKPNAI